MKINVNSPLLEAELHKTQKRALVRCFRPYELRERAASLELRLVALNIPKIHRVGAVAVIGLSEFPGKYKWNPEGTVINLTRGRAGWFVTYCKRANCEGKNHLRLTEKQKQIIAENAIRDAESIT